MSSAFQNSIVSVIPNTHTVLKRLLPHSVGHDLLTQKRIHALAQEICRPENNFEILRVPSLAPDAQNVPDYVMEQIDTSIPLYPRDNITMEILSEAQRNLLTFDLLRFFQRMWEHGFAPWGYDLYLQPDGSIVLLDFDKFGFRRPNWEFQVELPVQLPYYQEFFNHLCFPYNFQHRLAHQFNIRLQADREIPQ